MSEVWGDVWLVCSPLSPLTFLHRNMLLLLSLGPLNYAVNQSTIGETFLNVILQSLLKRAALGIGLMKYHEYE